MRSAWLGPASAAGEEAQFAKRTAQLALELDERGDLPERSEREAFSDPIVEVADVGAASLGDDRAERGFEPLLRILKVFDLARSRDDLQGSIVEGGPEGTSQRVTVEKRPCLRLPNGNDGDTSPALEARSAERPWSWDPKRRPRE
jgi:hypothetical protein